MHYTITIKTVAGQGDNGTDAQTVHDGQLNLAQLARIIIALEEKGDHICVFSGKGLEILQYATDQAEYLAE